MPPAKSQTPTTALVVSILSIVLGGMPIVGLILGLVGLNYAKRGETELAQGVADPSEAGMVKAAKICAIVGIVLGGISVAAMCLWASCAGFALLGMGGAAASGSGGVP